MSICCWLSCLGRLVPPNHKRLTLFLNGSISLFLLSLCIRQSTDVLQLLGEQCVFIFPLRHQWKLMSSCKHAGSISSLRRVLLGRYKRRAFFAGLKRRINLFVFQDVFVEMECECELHFVYRVSFHVDELSVAGKELASVSRGNACVFLISSEHSDFDSCSCQVAESVGNTFLQLIFNGTGSQDFQVVFHL